MAIDCCSDRLGFRCLTADPFHLPHNSLPAAGSPHSPHSYYYRPARRLAHRAGRAVETEERRRVAEKQIREGPAAVLQDHRVGLYPRQFYRNASMLAQECAHARARVRDSASISDCGDIAVYPRILRSMLPTTRSDASRTRVAILIWTLTRTDATDFDNERHVRQGRTLVNRRDLIIEIYRRSRREKFVRTYIDASSSRVFFVSIRFVVFGGEQRQWKRVEPLRSYGRAPIGFPCFPVPL